MDKIKFGDYVIPDGSIAPRSRPLPEPTAALLKGAITLPPVGVRATVDALLEKHVGTGGGA